MKNWYLIFLAFGLFACGGSEEAEGSEENKPQQEKVEFKTLQEEVSYCIGYSNCEELRMNIKQSNGMLAKYINLEEYYKGFKAYLLNEKMDYSQPEAEEIVSRYFVPRQLPDTNMIPVLKGSYCLGVQQAYATQLGLEKSGVWDKFSPQLMASGFNDALYQLTPQIPREEINQKVIDYMSQMNRIQGENFLKENGAREEVKTTESGLQYEVIEMGKGPKPTSTSKVKVYYKGTFLDGNVFDQRLAPQEPIEFSLMQVIPGWTEGIALMPKGSKFKLYIPFNLAYGHQGNQGIPPYSTLIFEVELLDFQ